MTPRERARRSLDGLSIGDALGQTFFLDRGPPDELVAARVVAPGPWRVSDDTVMAEALLEVLERSGAVDQDALARAFADRFAADSERGYGAVAYWQLAQLVQGRSWREVSREPFRGQGSLGNGAAMRVAPLGAWFADDLDQVVAQARLSADVTHAHPDGQAGALAVAVAAACASRGEDPLTGALARTPDGETRAGLERADGLRDVAPARAAAELGDGSRVTSADTVPFALLCATARRESFEEAMWFALGGLLEHDSDRDTVLAIVGGVVALSADPSTVPPAWRAAREPRP